MRAYEFLIEYDRSKTVQSLGKRIHTVIDNDNTFREKGETVEQQIEQLFDKFEAVDPSPNKQYVRWIATQYTKGMVKYEDLYKITDDLTEFTQYKPQLKRLGHSADINQYTPRTLTQLITQLSNTELNSEPDNPGDNATTDPDVKVLYNGPLGTLSTPLTQEASCKLGKGTRWCTAATDSENMYSHYTKSGPLYIWRDRSGEKYQFHLNTDDLEFSAMDAQDEEIEPEELGALKSNPILKKLFALFDQQYLDAIKSGARITEINYIYTLHPTGWPEIEPYLMKKPLIAIQYARDVIGGRWPAAEPVLMQDPISAANYARFILKKPWPAAEPYILKNSSAIEIYIDSVRKTPWPEAEKQLMKDPAAMVNYARFKLKRAWPEAEPKLLSSGNYDAIYDYIKYLKKERWPEAEPTIAKSPLAFAYARTFIKGRWSEAEPYILKDSGHALSYIEHVIKDRWKPAERIILKSPRDAARYARNILEEPWPEAEDVIKTDPSAAEQYADYVLGKPWPEAEDVIKTDPYAAARYAINVLRNRWPEAEELIKSEEDAWEDYKAELLDEDEYEDDDEDEDEYDDEDE